MAEEGCTPEQSALRYADEALTWQQRAAAQAVRIRELEGALHAAKINHLVVEDDGFYSCHLVGGGAEDYRSAECTCGADAHNAAIDRALLTPPRPAVVLQQKGSAMDTTMKMVCPLCQREAEITVAAEGETTRQWDCAGCGAPYSFTAEWRDFPEGKRLMWSLSQNSGGAVDTTKAPGDG